MRLNGFQDFLQELHGRCFNTDIRLGKILSMYPHPHFAERKGSSQHDNRIQDFRKDQRVDDMSLEGDGLRDHKNIVPLVSGYALKIGRFDSEAMMSDDILGKLLGMVM